MHAVYYDGRNSYEGIYVVVYKDDMNDEEIRSFYDETHVINLAQTETIVFIYFVAREGWVKPMSIAFKDGRLKLIDLGGEA